MENINVIFLLYYLSISMKSHNMRTWNSKQFQSHSLAAEETYYAS